MKADWGHQAVVYAATAAKSLCARCGKAIEAGDRCAWVPGLHSRDPSTRPASPRPVSIGPLGRASREIERRRDTQAMFRGHTPVPH